MQLSGFDSIDYRTKVDAQHIIRPETLHSTFDKPASITGPCREKFDKGRNRNIVSCTNVLGIENDALRGGDL